MILLWGIVLTSGLGLGVAFVAIWQTVSRRMAPTDFWPELHRLGRGLLTEGDDLPRLMALYRQLAINVLRYNLANLLGVGLAILPLIAAMTWAAPLALDQWHERAATMLVHPPGAPVEPTPGQRQAWCADTLTCLGYEMLWFSTARREAGPTAIARPDTQDGNPLWPYVSDLEFGFYLSFLLANGIALGVSRGYRRKP
ncbi:MAG: hypothetical protein H6954_17590 [Chromatiaceae bacterium]|nr:hypothetical protein [Chromatiaceae bacterium]